MHKRIRSTLVGVAAAAAGVVAWGQMAAPAWRLVWDDPNPPGLVTRYNVYQLTEAKGYQLLTSVPKPEWRIDLPPGLHTVAVSGVGINDLQGPMSTNVLIGVLVAMVQLRVVQ